MKRSELKDKVKRRLGWPMVKVEVCDDQLNDHIDYTRDKFIKWAIGNATDIIYFTIPLVGGQKFYDLPAGVLDILEYDDKVGSTGGINTLFSVENYFFNQGYYDPMFSYPYSLVGYHMVLDFMETLERYNPDKYNWRYHRKTNQLELTPTPEYNENNISVERIDPETNTIKTYTLDSPGYILLRANVVEGTTLPQIIREWDDVMKTIDPASEHRVINTDEENNNYFVLESPAINGKLDIYLNGQKYDEWNFYDDNRRIIRWFDKDEISLGDEIICKYNTITILPSDDDNSYVETFDETVENHTIDAIALTMKTFMLNEKTIDKEGVILKVNGNEYVYGDGFTIDTDNQTILFGTYTLDGVLSNGDVIEAVYVGESSNIEEYNESLYDRIWILDYVTALSKITLGIVRRKFTGFGAIGNTGIDMDGDAFVSEGKEEKERLEEELREEEAHEGMYLTMG